ncbi:hypothetical protein B0H12DRAFT_1104961 [Mycena haematopus]|nr:hypothetical protein B0H12DRAFT_1104961 [Mycena haematopus]
MQNPLTSVRPATPPRPPPGKFILLDVTIGPIFFVEDARDLGSSSPSDKYSTVSSPISGWSPTTVGSSPMKWRDDAGSRLPTPEESNSPRRGTTPMTSSYPEKESSYLMPPTPAQRRHPSPIPSPSLPAARKVSRSPAARILVPNSDTSDTSNSQPVESSPVKPLARTLLAAPIEDVEMLSEDDEKTDRRLFRRRGSPLERVGPAKRRRANENVNPAPRKLGGFEVKLDIERQDEWKAVGWDRVSALFRRQTV